MDDFPGGEIKKVPLPVPAKHAAYTPASTIAFDTSQELLWAGNDYGRVSGFWGANLAPYTAFKAGDGPVRQLLFHDRGVIALSAYSVHMASRRGPPIWHIVHDEFKDLKCMTYTSRGSSEILVAGLQDQMFIIDVDKGTVTKQIPTSDQYMILKRSRYICAATLSGTVNILNPITFQLVKSWKAHSSMISDMDAQHDFIVTCGYSQRQSQTYMLDPLVNVFDLKNLTSLPPIPFPSGAAYVRMHPRMLTTSIVVSQSGQMHIVDLMNPNTCNVKQANILTYLNMFEIAPSGQAIALSDSECYIHLWGAHQRLSFSELSGQVELPDVDEDHTQIDWSTDTPLNNIGMPYYREQLLSSWPSHMIFEVGAPPQRLEQALLDTLKGNQSPWALVGPKPRNLRRNQVENRRTAERSSGSLEAPRFLSERARESPASLSAETRVSDAADDIGPAGLLSLKAEVPVMYRNVEIKYSKFGVDDFDFGFYNKTSYSGLETHISNSYANPLLQLLHFTPLIRNIALQHAATSCVNDICLLCEMGFLFDMLEKAEGSICQATNFLKTFSHHPQAMPMGLLEEDTSGTPLTNMLQGLNRFLLEKIVQDHRSIAPHSVMFDQLLATSATIHIRCMNCRNEHTRPGSTYVNDFLYLSPKSPPRGIRVPKASFSQTLKSSIERETTGRGWCSRCQRYQALATRKTIHTIPPVLMLNAAIAGQDAKQLWATPGWLPEEIGVIVENGQFFCYQGDDLRLHVQRGAHPIAIYSLVGIAADIDSGQNQKSHLVSLVNVALSRPTYPGESQWHLFNDFLVRPIQTEEALAFNTTWKLPSVITYQLKQSNNVIDNTWKQNLDTSVLYKENKSLLIEKTYRNLSPQEAPKEGTIIALDTEFVSVRSQEIEMNSDGERETIRPTAYALARVSVIRGSGDDEGLPFIDDYILAREPIVNYLTNFSGISPGDLNPQASKHNLVSLKVAYKKLWVLLNLGCRFLGHGLKQDFRVANIHVPKCQIIDTSEFFYVQERLRKLSLSFLAWFLLKEQIQLETHDSIEDARTALKLYRKYQEFQDAGVLEQILQDIYNKGRSIGYKMPSKQVDGLMIQRAETPPMPPPEGSAPTTPVRRPIGLVPGVLGSASSFGGGNWTPGRGAMGGQGGFGFGGSPLR